MVILLALPRSSGPPSPSLSPSHGPRPALRCCCGNWVWEWVWEWRIGRVCTGRVGCFLRACVCAYVCAGCSAGSLPRGGVVRGRGRGRGRVEIWVPNFGFGGQRVGGFDGIHACCLCLCLCVVVFFYFIILYCIVFEEVAREPGRSKGASRRPPPTPLPIPPFLHSSFFLCFLFFFF